MSLNLENQRHEKAKKKHTSEFLRDFKSLILEIVLIMSVVVAVYCFLFGFLRADDRSMFPAVRDGDLVVYDRLDKDYAQRDLLAMKADGNMQVRRVIGVAGDSIDFKEGVLLLNGIPQDELGVYEKSEQFKEGVSFPLVVPEGQVFVMGDAREHATDSRIYGCVNRKETYGTVILVVRRRDF